MRIPYTWLREYCDPGLAVEELAERVALRTTEVERISYVGPPSAEGFVVGKVLSVAPHPDADRLNVCEVETGDETRTIVCGAPNVAAGQTVPVALPGAVMPGGEKLGRAKLRGVTSDGMILSEVELQIGDDSAGIAVLHPASDPAAPGREAEEAADRYLGICTVYQDLHSVRYGYRAWIEDLAVNPEHRSLGIGKALLGAAKDWARERGATHLELDSGEARTDAHRFYEREHPAWRGMQYAWLL